MYAREIAHLVIFLYIYLKKLVVAIFIRENISNS